MQDDEQQIRDVITRWLEATMQGDLDTIMSLVDENVRFLMPGQTSLDKQDFRMTQQAAAQYDLRIRHDIQEIRVSGDLAYCWNHLEVEIRLPGEADCLKRGGNTLTILTRSDDRWTVLREANLLTEHLPDSPD